jgi:hypothetical protein
MTEKSADIGLKYVLQEKIFSDPKNITKEDLHRLNIAIKTFEKIWPSHDPYTHQGLKDLRHDLLVNFLENRFPVHKEEDLAILRDALSPQEYEKIRAIYESVEKIWARVIYIKKEGEIYTFQRTDWVPMITRTIDTEGSWIVSKISILKVEKSRWFKEKEIRFRIVGGDGKEFTLSIDTLSEEAFSQLQAKASSKEEIDVALMFKIQPDNTLVPSKIDPLCKVLVCVIK